MTRNRWRAATPIPKRWREWQAPVDQPLVPADPEQLDPESLLEPGHDQVAVKRERDR